MNSHPFLKHLHRIDPVVRHGRVRRLHSTYLEADGPDVPLGTQCEIEAVSEGHGPASLLATVVRVDDAFITLAPYDSRNASFAGARVTAAPLGHDVAAGDGFCGRAIDGLGRPIDSGPVIGANDLHPLAGVTTPALARQSPLRMLETGIRAIDTLLTLGVGQRVGLFAASGVGKTSLLAQLAANVSADRCVICLVGERGREVAALWNESLPASAKARTVLVAATSDDSAALRVRAVDQALALADHWRQHGLHVLLLLDSATRLAMALREVGLAAGEPPTVRGYTPSVFAAIPRIVERCGALVSGGAITAVMTVLSDTDDIDDPVSEMMKSLLDGHIILSRRLSEQGHFPAIDVPRSVSRQSHRLMGSAEAAAARAITRQLSIYETSRTLIEAGLYTAGSDPQIDAMLAVRPKLLAFLQQPGHQRVSYSQSSSALSALTAGIG